jgi:hypothetical protein
MTITVDRDVDLMLVAGNGVGWTVDKGAVTPAAPADPAATPSSGWIPVGAVTEDGLTNAFDEDRTGVRVWGIQTDFRTIVTSSITTFQLSLRETERDICVSLFYKKSLADLARSGGVRSYASESSPAPDRRPFLFKVIDGEVIKQFFIPEGEVTDRADVQYQPSDSAIYQLTISTYPDAVGNTVYVADNAPATPIGSNS